MGAVTFGAVDAMLPIIQREIVEKRQWATEAELWILCNRSMHTGIIAVNTSTFIGYKRKGIAGGLQQLLVLYFRLL